MRCGWSQSCFRANTNNTKNGWCVSAWMNQKEHSGVTALITMSVLVTIQSIYAKDNEAWTTVSVSFKVQLLLKHLAKVVAESQHPEWKGEEQQRSPKSHRWMFPWSRGASFLEAQWQYYFLGLIGFHHSIKDL